MNNLQFKPSFWAMAWLLLLATLNAANLSARSPFSQKIEAATYLKETKVYALPSLESDILRKIPANETVEVLQMDLGVFCKIRYKGQTGYVVQKELIFDSDAAKGAIGRRGESAFEQDGSATDKLAVKPKIRTYYRGPKGGCYYINAHGNKQYVDRYLCE